MTKTHNHLIVCVLHMCVCGGGQSHVYIPPHNRMILHINKHGYVLFYFNFSLTKQKHFVKSCKQNINYLLNFTICLLLISIIEHLARITIIC